jgi:hypothetical protein
MARYAFRPARGEWKFNTATSCKDAAKSRKNLVGFRPIGANENSPAIYRWE